MRKYLTNNKVKSLLVSIEGPVKLNIGCGTDYKKGWINIDNNSDNNIEKLDLNWDLRNSLPFANNSVDFVFNEHFIEHLTIEEGQTVIKDLMRVLKPGGVMRIAMPDLRIAVNDYLNLPLEKDPVIKRFDLDFIKTRAERINMAFRGWGHQWLYDAEELTRRLKEAGCENIKQCRLGHSKYASLQNLETRHESTLIMEVIK
jgi:predicted SAM-dependent methyltransferase